MQEEISGDEERVLSVVGTPIGNLEDMTFRAVETLRSSDLVVCEDTRVTKKLLDRYDIDVSTIAHHHHSTEKVTRKIVHELRKGKKISLVTDAGTPGISDPGNVLVSRVLQEGFRVIPIPGVSAITTLVSVAGIDTQQFIFLGFVPHKKGRQTFFDRVIASDIPAVYYDSVHRVMKNLKLLAEKAPNTHVIIGRELTKIFEEVVRGSVEEVLNHFEEKPEKVKGEFVIIAYKTGNH